MKLLTTILIAITTIAQAQVAPIVRSSDGSGFGVNGGIVSNAVLTNIGSISASSITLTNMPILRVQNTIAQTNADFNAVQSFGTTLTNRCGGWDGTNKYTIPQDGGYILYTRIRYASSVSGSRYGVQILVNGSAASSLSEETGTGTTVTPQQTEILYLTNNAVVQVASGGITFISTNTAALCFFEAMRVW